MASPTADVPPELRWSVLVAAVVAEWRGRAYSKPFWKVTQPRCGRDGLGSLYMDRKGSLGSTNMVAAAAQFLKREGRRRLERLHIRLQALFGPPCPGCGRKVARPETDRSPIWQCTECGARYLPSAPAINAKDSR